MPMPKPKFPLSKDDKNNNLSSDRKRRCILLAAALIVAATAVFLAGPRLMESKPVEIPYTQFLEYVEKSNIEKATYKANSSTITVYAKDGTKYETQNPKYTEFKKDMLEAGIEVEESGSVSQTVSTIMPFLYIVLLGIVLRNTVGKVGADAKFDKNEGSNIPSVTFDDVKGQDEVKADLALYIDFLKDPEKYQALGGSMPKGVLLYGPPGTGKTLLAKAIAGEAGVPFKAVNASDFDELYQGLGAQRVRKLFAWANENAPCILFIDELDAVGSTRGSKNEGNERQTLNALLAAMDGFDGSNGVFIIAATNRLDDLDPALIRSKRFDHHFAVPIPTTSVERREIIDYYVRNKRFTEDVDFDKLAKDTMGCSPATIDALINDAALIAAHKELPAIDNTCIEEAWYKETMQGHAKKRSERDQNEIAITAWHESGHALMAILLKKDVRKVSIVPSTSGAGGFTAVNQEKMGMYSKKELEDEVKVLYAGQVAEELLAGVEGVTTGASNDIHEASKIIMCMISSYGMSDFGMLDLSVVGVDKERISACAMDISNQLRQEVRSKLWNHKEDLAAMAQLLSEKETVSGEELSSFFSALGLGAEILGNSIAE